MSGKKKIRVGLIYGGKSGEHEVSLSTALAVMKSFDFDKYEISPLYITKEGEWRSGPLLHAPVEHAGLLQYEADLSSPTGSALMPLFDKGDAGAAAQGIDVMFPLLHGTFGEDGTIQGLFEMANMPYVGAGVLASAVGMDKVVMKKLFAQAGLPQCLYRFFTRRQWEKDANYYVMEIEVALGYPCFVKPANLGSSVGVSKARNREELIAAIELALRYDRKVIVEEFIDAREIEVAVLGNEDAKASVPGEIVSSSEFYDYQAKYIDGKSAMVIPADIPAELAEELRELAVQAFHAIDGSGLSRMDFFVQKQDQKIMINEVNTMPGFTPFSMYPLMWRETGLSYQALLDRLIELAMERYEEKQHIDYGNTKPQTVTNS